MKPGVAMNELKELIKELNEKKEININKLVDKINLSENEFEQLLTEIEKSEIKVVDDKVEDKDLENNLSSMKSSLDIYFNEIKKYPLLTKTEELELIKKYKNGSREVRNIIICRNLRLVIYIAKRYKSKIEKTTLSFHDIIQEGNLGLIDALEKYDYTKGYKFSTYATWWINQKIYRAIQNNSDIIRKPISMQQKVKEIQEFQYEYKNTTGNEATIEVCAKNTGYTNFQVNNIIQAMKNVYSLDDFLKNEEESERYIDVIIDKKDCYLELENRDYFIYILNILKEILTPFEYEIICFRYCMKDNKCKTLEELAKKYGKSKERIRQIEARALRKSRLFLQNQDKNKKDGEKNGPFK